MEDATVDLSIIVPAYNEAKRIENTIIEVARFVQQNSIRHEIIVVDDGSTDETVHVVRRAMWPLRVIRLEQNCGKGAALRRGVAESRGIRVLTMDADLPTPMCEVHKLFRALEAGAMIAAGSRMVRGARVRQRQPLSRILLGRLGNLWIRLFTDSRLADSQCGIKLYDGNFARRLFALCKENGFAIDIELLNLARTAFGSHIAEVGVDWEHREGSKVTWGDYLRVMLAVVRIASKSRHVEGHAS